MAQPPDASRDTPPPEKDLAQWMVQYGPGLRRFFSRRAGAAQAEDLVQEVFLRLQNAPGQEPVENVERYLFRIAHNVLVSRYRHDAARALARHDALDEAFDAPDHISPERILAAKQEYARAIVAILNLPPRARAAFTFHRFENMTYHAIGDRMGTSKESVKELMQRAIDRLSAEMEREP